MRGFGDADTQEAFARFGAGDAAGAAKLCQVALRRDKRNVAAILTYGASDNLITAPTRQGALAPPQTLDLLGFADQSVADANPSSKGPAPASG